MKEYALIEIKTPSYEVAVAKLKQLVNKHMEIGFVPMGSPTLSYCDGEYVILLFMVEEVESCQE